MVYTEHHHLHFNDCSPGESGLASSALVYFFYLFQNRSFGDKWRKKFTRRMSFLSPKQKFQSTEANPVHISVYVKHSTIPSILCKSWLGWVHYSKIGLIPSETQQWHHRRNLAEIAPNARKIPPYRYSYSSPWIRKVAKLKWIIFIESSADTSTVNCITWLAIILSNCSNSLAYVTSCVCVCVCDIVMLWQNAWMD